MAMQLSDSYCTPHPAMSTSRSCVALSSYGQSSTSVKIGGLWKRSQGVSRFTKPNYKHRVFILTHQALSYYGGTVDRVGQLKGRIPLESVRAVEFIDVSAFNLAHSLQVIYVSKKSGFVTLYIIATTKEECSDWVATLRQACYFNRDMLMHYHTGAFVKGKWNCCLQHGRTTLGCQPTYHLLTRSSSRYAQMRRKDTLTNSSTSLQRRARAGSRGSHAYTDHRSTAMGALTDVEDVPTSAGDVIVTSCAQGLSNSFMELSMHPPHTEDTFTLSSPPANWSSRRSSKNSTEHSTGFGTMVLNHVSLSEMPTSEVAVMLERYDSESSRRRQSGSVSSSQSHTPRFVRNDRGRAGGRSQVWPTSTPISTNNSQRGLGYEPELKTLPRSFKSRSPGLANSWSGPHKSEERAEPVGGEEAIPVPPPRLKKGSNVQSQTTSSVSIPSGQCASLYSALNSPSRTVAPCDTPLSKMRHSKTFLVHRGSSACRNLQAKKHGFSQSMGALTKPLIEPKVSVSNPNVIHV